jgi:hypothetical protein
MRISAMKPPPMYIALLSYSFGFDDKGSTNRLD